MIMPHHQKRKQTGMHLNYRILSLWILAILSARLLARVLFRRSSTTSACDEYFQKDIYSGRGSGTRTITTVEQLLEKLGKIKLKNSEGHLATLIRFLAYEEINPFSLQENQVPSAR
jgi:hypothetical protein